MPDQHCSFLVPWTVAIPSTEAGVPRGSRLQISEADKNNADLRRVGSRLCMSALDDRSIQEVVFLILSIDVGLIG